MFRISLYIIALSFVAGIIHCQQHASTLAKALESRANLASFSRQQDPAQCTALQSRIALATFVEEANQSETAFHKGGGMVERIYATKDLRLLPPAHAR